MILNPDPSRNQSMELKKSLSTTYPNLPFNEALQKENAKLQLELQRSQANMDVGQCEVIQHLIGVTETVASSLPDKDTQNSKKSEPNHSDAGNDKVDSYAGNHKSQHHETYVPSRLILKFHSLNMFLYYISLLP